MSSTPTESISAKVPSQLCSWRYPAGVTAHVSHPSSTPRVSSAAATWKSRCVSTPPVTGPNVSVIVVVPLLSIREYPVAPRLPGRWTRQRWALSKLPLGHSTRPVGVPSTHRTGRQFKARTTTWRQPRSRVRAAQCVLTKIIHDDPTPIIAAGCAADGVSRSRLWFGGWLRCLFGQGAMRDRC